MVLRAEAGAERLIFDAEAGANTEIAAAASEIGSKNLVFVRGTVT